VFDLQPVGQYVLDDPPIAQVLGQVRFPMVARLQTTEGIANLQDALSTDYPYMTKVSETVIGVPTSGPLDLKQEETLSWHFSDDDGRLVVVGPNIVTLSMAKQYAGFTDFEKRFRSILKTMKEVVRLSRLERLAIRFLDLVPASETEDENSSDWFQTEIAGWNRSALITKSTRLQSSMAQLHLVTTPSDELSLFPAEAQAVIRFGVVPKGSVVQGIPPVEVGTRSFLLDMDIFVTAPQPYDVEAATEQLRVLHGQADRFFRWSLTPAGEKHFGLQEKS